MQMLGSAGWMCLFVVLLGTVQSDAGVALVEPATDNRPFSLRCRMQVDGQIQTATQSGTALGLKLKVDARLSYLERRLPAAGEDAKGLRSLRSYQVAEADIDVAGKKTTRRLHESARMIVAEGSSRGVQAWSPDVLMTYESLELLRTPGDSLALTALLPGFEVDADSTWDPEYWVLPLLTGVEAVSKTELTCRVQKIDDSYVIFDMNGSIEGAIDGAFTKIQVKGQVAWDIEKKHIRQAQITQTEERAVGAVSPGMKVSATMYVDRQIAEGNGALTDDRIGSIPLEPESQALDLAFLSPWRLQFQFDRNWHVFHQTKDVAVLRLVENGSLIAQCNVSKVPSVLPGTHTSDEDFQKDIATALGNQITRFEKTGVIPTDDGRRLFRVWGIGSSRDVGMHWLYYLCTAPDGRQAAFAFSVESKLAAQLANRDLQIVRSLKFLPVATKTAKRAGDR